MRKDKELYWENKNNSSNRKPLITAERIRKIGSIIVSFSAMCLGAYLGTQISYHWNMAENEQCLQKLDAMLQDYMDSNNAIIEASNLQIELEQDLWEEVYPQMEQLMSDLQVVSEELKYFQQLSEASDSSD